jgi:hypothetical protein
MDSAQRTIEPGLHGNLAECSYSTDTYDVMCVGWEEAAMFERKEPCLGRRSTLHGKRKLYMHVYEPIRIGKSFRNKVAQLAHTD